MNSMAAGPMIADQALMTNGGQVREVLGENGSRLQLSHGRTGSSESGQVKVVSGLCSERVLSLLIALEALRAAPAALDLR